MSIPPLAAAIARATDHARATGALLPLASERITLTEGGVDFRVHWLSSLALKDAAKLFSTADKPANYNPFLPYEQDLFVAELSSTHVALLNKFPLLERHILMVTRGFEEQLSALTIADFDAVARTLAQLDGLVFYNGGTLGGASQPHKHLQWVPAGSFTLETILPAAKWPDRPRRLVAFDFRHAFISLDDGQTTDPARAAAYLLEAFNQACAECGITAENGKLPPYNLLAGRRWMLVVPRRREYWEDGGERVSMNAMSFAGSLFVRRPEQIELVRKAGPLALLRAVTYPVRGEGDSL